MPKQPRKRQKTSYNHEQAVTSTKAARLAMLLDDEGKDDEERKLESMLFGVEYQPRAKSAEKRVLDDSEQSDDGEEDGRGMQHLLDQDLFFVDNTLDEDASKEVGISDLLSSSSRSKPPAWVDPADAQPTKISLLNGPSRIRKLRQAVDEDEITGREYETRLRNQFERINPEPEWARKVRREKKEKKKSAQRGGGGEDSDEGKGGDVEGIQELLTSTGGILANNNSKKEKGGGRVLIRQGSLAIERVRDANHSTQSSNSGEVRVVAFHPKPAVPVLCVATATDRRVRLFHIDGHLSPLLTTLHLPSLPLISSSSVLFHPSGNSLLVTGPRPFFYTYDLQQGSSTFHRRGLWGTGFDDTTLLNPSASSSYKRRRGRSGEAAAKTSGGGGRGGGGNTEAILHAAFSGGTGSMLAVAGRGGNVHLVDWRSGAGQVVGSLRCTTVGGGGGGGVAGLWWVPSATGDGDVLGGSVSGLGDCEKHLAVLTGEAEVFIWDVGQRRCVKRWKDEGGYRGAGRVMAGGGGPNGWLAIGSTSGYVNVYDSDSFAVPNNSLDTASSFGRENPKLVKALGHLTTPISTLKFNHDGQILAMASMDKKDALRFVHLPSLTAFANWPTSSTPLGHVTAVDFASRSEYVAIGNTRGRVLLYHLKDYGADGGVGVGYSNL